MKKLYPKRFMFLLNEDMYNQLKKLAETDECSMGEVIRQLITNTCRNNYSERDDEYIKTI